MSEIPENSYELSGDGQGEEDKSKKKKKHKRSRKSRSKESRKKSRSRSRKSRSRRASRSRSRSPRRSKKRSHRRSRSRSRSPIPLQRREERERDGPRDAYTVFVTQLHPRVEERDLFEFFSHVGRVEDIRLIRDQRTHKSKGLAYVEFWDKDCVNKAIALTGQELGGYPITVQITPTATQPPKPEENKPMRLYVGSLHFNITESDLRPVFEAFGPVESIDLHKDPVNGKSRGFGFVTYKNESDARQALQNLNGIEIAGRPMKVGVVSDSKDDGGDAIGVGDLDEDGGGGLALTAASRVQLMQKLQRGNEIVGGYGSSSTPAITSSGYGSQSSGGSGVIAADRLTVPLIQPSTCVVVKHMFDPKEEKDPDFHLDIKEDVEEECTKFGKLKHIFVDKNSQGHVYLRFENVDGAKKCVENLNGRWFASKRITAEFVVEATYLLKFPDAK